MAGKGQNDMKRYDFNSFDEFHAAEVSGEWEALTVVTEGGWINSDIMTECKSWKTALRRFFKALDPDNSDVFSVWHECMMGSAENGYFKMNDFTMADGSRNPCPSYAWEIEDMNDGEWYIFLNIHPGEYETEAAEVNGTETAEDAETETSEGSENETTGGTDYTSETAEPERAEATEGGGHERRRTPERDIGGALSARSALSASPPFLR